MSNIVRFENYSWGKRTSMKFQELVNELKAKNEKRYEYSLSEIAKIANIILDNLDYYSDCGATPIVKIAKEFDFKTYKETLKPGKSGDIKINGNTAELYNHDKIILVNKKDELFHQRFVVAHELAHYLFEFLGNPDYNDKSILFTDTYKKDHHETPQEKRANAFAAEIMMPRDLFLKQYMIARRESNSHMFIVMYLSRFFETSIEAIEKRILEVSV